MAFPKLKCNVLVAMFLLLAFSLTSKPVQSQEELAQKAQAQEELAKQEKDKELKIIALAPHIVEMLFEIGAGQSIIGTSEHSDYPEEAKAIPRVGNYARLNIEHILALQPDVIIAWRSGTPSDDLERLKQFGLNVVYSQPQHLLDVSKEIRELGELTGNQAIAEQKALKFEAQLANIKHTYQEKRPVSVFYEIWAKPLTTVARNAWPQQQLALCQASNPFIDLATDYPQVNLEQVFIANPQVIIQPHSSDKTNPDAINWQNYQQIDGAKHRQILHPNADKLHRMSFRLVDELEKLCQDLDNSRRFYQQMSDIQN